MVKRWILAFGILGLGLTVRGIPLTSPTLMDVVLYVLLIGVGVFIVLQGYDNKGAGDDH